MFKIKPLVILKGFLTVFYVKKIYILKKFNYQKQFFAKISIISKLNEISCSKFDITILKHVLKSCHYFNFVKEHE